MRISRAGAPLVEAFGSFQVTDYTRPVHMAVIGQSLGADNGNETSNYMGPAQLGVYQQHLVKYSEWREFYGREVGILTRPDRGVFTGARGGSDMADTFDTPPDPTLWEIFMSTCHTLGSDPVVLDVVWGNTDARDETKSLGYYDRLVTARTLWQAEFDTPILVQQLHEDTVADYVTNVRTAKSDFAATYGDVFLYSVDDLTLVDTDHLDATGIYTAGARAAALAVLHAGYPG